MQTWKASAFYQALNGNQRPSCKFTPAAFGEKGAQIGACLAPQDPLGAKSWAPADLVVCGSSYWEGVAFVYPVLSWVGPVNDSQEHLFLCKPRPLSRSP